MQGDPLSTRLHNYDPNLPDGQWFDPLPLQSVCQRVLGQDTKGPSHFPHTWTYPSVLPRHLKSASSNDMGQPTVQGNTQNGGVGPSGGKTGRTRNPKITRDFKPIWFTTCVITLTPLTHLFNVHHCCLVQTDPRMHVHVNPTFIQDPGQPYHFFQISTSPQHCVFFVKSRELIKEPLTNVPLLSDEILNYPRQMPFTMWTV